ncbi:MULTISPECIES: lysophospholipid acyltransferase family protein [Lactobacillaceae]|uniref:lysophospholipid acyltransferase family protein n=1 Tax=Lactobacillaceae TaxID=33958 RepID=UPI001456D4FF|nr:lysophospholipid acyltransferase family protein [Lactobacillus sp. HBUAS51381]NLR10035.1 1-acyl-sn-glycerol-3-phosphate acyltransferase [Lactobacillus sp. HBUAS51381]
MIIGGMKEKVVENIEHDALTGQFNAKVEVSDPVFTKAQQQAVLQRYLRRNGTLTYRLNNHISRRVAGLATRYFNRRTRFEGLANLQGITGGAIITSNHFNPLDNTVVRRMVQRTSQKRLYIVSRDTNLEMGGFIGYLMNYYDTIPISDDKEYAGRIFPKFIQSALAQQQYVLIYPEQEMWFNYRKPRPVKRGAYYYAAKFQVPILSCFVEIRDLPRVDNAEFDQVSYVMHVLKPIFPDPQKSVRENSRTMMATDYQQKKAAYERAYGKPLTYQFEPGDIAGWRGERMPVTREPEKTV